MNHTANSKYTLVAPTTSEFRQHLLVVKCGVAARIWSATSVKSYKDRNTMKLKLQQKVVVIAYFSIKKTDLKLK